MRKFKLLNADNKEFDLMRKDAFLSAPDGLGFSMENSYALIGSDYLMTYEKPAQHTVTGEMVFSSYAQYEEFARFIAVKPLRLLYMPRKKWLYTNCTVTRLDKGEISTATSLLHCAVDFTCTSKWYIPGQSKPGTNVVSDALKTYAYKYPYVYGDDRGAMVEINNDGVEEAPCIITIYGKIVDPVWRCYQNDTLVSSGAITGTIEEGHKIVINAEYGESEIAEYTSGNDYVQNRYQDIDFDRDAFFYAPIGYSKLIVSGKEIADKANIFVQIDTVYDTL